MEGRQLPDIYTAVFILCIVTRIDASASGVAERCSKSYYLSDGECYQCPDRCTSCTSDDNCLQCIPGFYGKACHRDCQQCPGQCHKEYGHCSQGCPDGQFPDPNSTSACLYCKPTCKLCSSLIDCVKCQKGFSGKVCNKRCSELCTKGRCYQNGECLNCKTGYYKSESVCVKCPRRCFRCSDASTCSKCKDGYFGPYSGTCFEQCPSEIQARYFASHLDQGRCDSSTCRNACHSKGYCIEDTITGNNDQIENKNICGVFLYRECTQNCSVCEPSNREGTVCNDEYICTDTCDFNKRPSTDGARMCWHNISKDILEEPTSYKCVTVSDNTSHTGISTLTIIVLALIGTIVLVLTLTGCIFYWKCNRKPTTNNSFEKSDDEREETTTFNNDSTGDVSSNDTQPNVQEIIAKIESKQKERIDQSFLVGDEHGLSVGKSRQQCKRNRRPSTS